MSRIWRIDPQVLWFEDRRLNGSVVTVVGRFNGPKAQNSEFSPLVRTFNIAQNIINTKVQFYLYRNVFHKSIFIKWAKISSTGGTHYACALTKVFALYIVETGIQTARIYEYNGATILILPKGP